MILLMVERRSISTNEDGEGGTGLRGGHTELSLANAGKQTIHARNVLAWSHSAVDRRIFGGEKQAELFGLAPPRDLDVRGNYEAQ
jgi:hypothetical protein